MSKNYIIMNGTVKFDGQCEKTRSFCGSVCCKNTIVLLTEEEKNSGKYEFANPTKGCNCSTCQLMRKTNRVALKKRAGGCYLLDGTNKCSVYDDRPEHCRNYRCEDVWWNLVLPTIGGMSISSNI